MLSDIIETMPEYSVAIGRTPLQSTHHPRVYHVARHPNQGVQYRTFRTACGKIAWQPTRPTERSPMTAAALAALPLCAECERHS